MRATRIVTGILIVSLNVACKAKFTSVNNPQGSAGATAAPAPVNPQFPSGPQVPKFDEPVPNAGTDTRPPVNNEPDVQPPRTCDTSGDGTIDPRRPVAERTVVFHQGVQMVWRKNCEGKVVSKRYEEVKKAGRQNIRWIHNGRGLFTAYNRTTCASMSPIQVSSNARGELVLSVSLDPTANALHVKRGRNVIDYEIGGARGTLILNVKVDRSGKGCVVYKAKNCAPRHRDQDWSLGGDVFGH